MMGKKPEILAPAGSMEALKAAVISGADAVYLGGSKYGARAYADNFDEQTLIEGIEYCHLYGVKVYLTVNTLFRNEEMNGLYDYLSPFYCAGLDAVIVQDLGVLDYIHRHFPDLPIHASTQMTITTPYAYGELRQYGVTRVVPGRELSNEELFAMKEQKNPPELEVFVQGALCYCYSGQCLMSSFLGGRSGNRGRCAQPCRLPYEVYNEYGDLIDTKGSYVLSPKDLCGLDNIGKLIEMGIDSFKIEGRMKKPLYVAACVRAYRKAVDAYYHLCLSEELLKSCKEEMAAVFNRGGFTKGYYEIHNGSQMMSLKQPGNAGVEIGKVISKNKNQIELLLKANVQKGDLFILKIKDTEIHLTCNLNAGKNTKIWLNTSNGKAVHTGDMIYRMQNATLEKELNAIISQDKKISLKGKLELITGKPALLELSYGDFFIQQNGKLVEVADKQPVTSQVIKDKICQLGNTRYEIIDLEMTVSEDAFYSMKDLKELRRNALKRLEEERLLPYKRNKRSNISADIPKRVPTKKKLTAITRTAIMEISTMEQFDALKSYENMKDVYLDLQYFSIEDIIKLLEENIHYNFWIVLPAVFRKEAYSDVEYITSLRTQNLKGIVVRNIDEYALLRHISYDREIIADSSLYVMNEYAGKFFDENVMTTVPVELNEREIRDLCSVLPHQQICVYGYQQLMVSAQCVCNHTIGCKKNNHLLILKDRYHKDFYVKSICKYCYSLVYNGLPTVLYDIESLPLQSEGLLYRFHFTIETKEQVTKVLNSFLNGSSYEGKRTKGHFSRGVE